MSEQPLYKSYQPRSNAPLFIRFVNADAGPADVVRGLITGTKDEKTREIAERVLQGEFEMSQFREDLASLLDDIIANGLYHPAVNYLNSYMEPSLLEHNEETAIASTGNTKKWLSIRKEESPWVEAVVCYNLTLYVKVYGSNKVKKCPACKRYFVNSKMAYSYCSESCKRRSGT